LIIFILSLLAFAALFLAFSNGANDNFKGFATVWGAAALEYRKALILATVATVLGGVASVILAHGLIDQFSGKGLVGNDLAATPRFALSVASGAGLTVILATRFGFPISTTHALVGGLIGAALAQSNAPIHLGKLGSNFIVPLLTSPIISATLAWLIVLILRSSSRKAQEDAPASGPWAHRIHLLSATSICFARGVNDTPKLAALLVAASLLDGTMAAIGVTMAMGIGGWLLSRRVAETMSHKINRLDHAQGISANLVTATLVLCASRLGLPVSTTHVSVGSIIGGGAAAGTLDLSVVRNIVLSWVATLPIAAAIAFAVGFVA